MSRTKLNKKQKPATIESIKVDIERAEEGLKGQTEIVEGFKTFMDAELAYQQMKITDNGFERITPEFKFELNPKHTEYVLVMLKDELKTLTAKRKGQLMEGEYKITVLTESIKELKEQLIRLEKVGA